MMNVSYRELISHLGIPPGSMLMVTADLTRLAMLTRRKEGEFRIGLFIDSLQDHLGAEGTLIIPAFNFNLKNNGHFHPVKSLPVTGSLAVETLKRPDFQRTSHPLHSFMVWGRESNMLSSLNNTSSFSMDSPFAFMREHHALMLLIDTTVSAAFTFVHHVEEIEKVWYRRYKKIGIFVDRSDGKPVRKDYLLYAKKAGWTMALDGLEKLLEDGGIAKKMTVNQVICTLVDLAAAYPLIKNDILHNQAKNLARFSLDLYLREKTKAILAAAGIHTLSDKISHDPGLL
jgi:aminoglycoside 3-N-acetyltransferase